MRWYYGFFVVSVFYSLVYEVVWLRLAMAAFGVTTPFVSIVLSVFMAALALGSWAAGRLPRRLGAVPSRLALRLYAAVEALIGVSGIAVPGELAWGRVRLAERAVAWDSSTYYLASGAWIALTLLPYCIAMGATFPLAMAPIPGMFGERAQQSFSYLYVANVLGATAGTIGSALVLIELFGFRGTLLVAASLNGLLAASALALSFGLPANAPLAPGATARRDRIAAPAAPTDRTAALACLFLTGLISMGLEVVWIRQFTPYLGTVGYTFAGILGVYLVATLVGSRLYRSVQGRGDAQSSAWAASIWMLFGLSALLPMATTDPRVPLPRRHAVWSRPDRLRHPAAPEPQLRDAVPGRPGPPRSHGHRRRGRHGSAQAPARQRTRDGSAVGDYEDDGPSASRRARPAASGCDRRGPGDGGDRPPARVLR